jgi:hypothetical protein
VAVSDDPRSSVRIARFAASSDPWIVAVRMISEGVDIPRLRIGVYATTTATELFFRQAVGRLVRWTRGVPRQKAWLFIPDDARLRTFAAQIAESRRHSLAQVRARAAEDGRPPPDPAALDDLVHDDDRRSASLFAPLSAVVTHSDIARAFSVFDADADDGALDLLDDEAGPAGGVAGDAGGYEIALPPLPGRGPHRGGGGGDPGRPSPRQRRLELRERNQKLVQELVWITGLTHAQVNGRLNRAVGLRRIDEATIDQLARRATAAERWLASP